VSQGWLAPHFVGWRLEMAANVLVVVASLVLRYGVELPVLALRDRYVRERPRLARLAVFGSVSRS
jgi:hypothetical protein